MTDEEQGTEFRVEREDNSVALRAAGWMDFTNSDAFRDELRKAAAEFDDVLVDLREVQFIDTAILAYLAQAAKVMRQRGKQLSAAVRKNSHPERVLLLSCFDQLIKIQSEPVASG